jgi:glycosyltransferase involved in cell wall biosynthesis
VRVALVGPFPVDPSRVSGGVETAFTAFVDGLSSLPDVEPHVLTFVPGQADVVLGEVAGVPVQYLPGTTRLGSATLHVRERRTLARALTGLRPDVLHGQETARYGYVSLKSARFAPVVLNVHGIVREEVKFTSGVSGLRQRTAGIALERYCIRHGRYFVQSTSYPERVFAGETSGVFVDVRNPIAGRFFDLERAPEPGRIVYAGSVIARKRLLDLVEAMPRVLAVDPGARLRVAGGEPEPEYSREVRERIRALGIGEHVKLLGPRSPDQVLDEYRLASVFVLPSGQETSPLSIGEAMAAGLPVVATDVGGVAELVEDGVTGYVVPVGAIPALADRIASVLGRPAESSMLAAAARERADRDFRPGVAARRLRAVYERAMAERGRG